jgi:hypothetical protein
MLRNPLAYKALPYILLLLALAAVLVLIGNVILPFMPALEWNRASELPLAPASQALPAMDEVQQADAARFAAMANYYQTLRIRQVDAARWNAQAAYFANQGLTRAQITEAARLNAAALHYQNASGGNE